MNASELIGRVFDRAKELGLRGELATLAMMSPERIEYLERVPDFTAAEYEKLCRALAVDPVAMYRGEGDRPRRSPARFRVATSLDRPDPGDVRLLSLAAEQGRILAHLVEMRGGEVRLARFRRTEAIAPARDGEIWLRGYDLGESSRNALFDEPGPIREFEQLLRDLGVHVARVTFSSADIDAASVWEPDAIPVVLVNEGSARTKHLPALRATLAHELCHLLHDSGERDITTLVSWGEEGHGNYDDAIEARARAFAPAFLAPRSQTREWAGTLRESRKADGRKFVAALAEHWGLSYEGAVWHAKNCRLVEADRAEKLAHQDRKPRLSYSTFENAPAGVQPSMFHEALPEEAAPLWDGKATEIVLAALEEGHITAGRARELLSWR